MEPPPTPSLHLLLLPVKVAVCRLPADAPEPEWARPGSFRAVVQTLTELSVVCEERFVPPEVKAERGWRILMVEGPLDFALIGVLASLTQPLAAARVSVFAISTFDTDYLLVKEHDLVRAKESLALAGHLVEENTR